MQIIMHCLSAAILVGFLAGYVVLVHFACAWVDRKPW